MKKQIAAAAAMLLLGLHMTAPMQQVCAETDPDCMLCAEDQGLNLDAHNYRAWAAPVRSYLHPLADGCWMLVQSEQTEGSEIVVKYFDADFRLTKRLDLARMLPDFGAFYAASDGNYYVITGDSTVSDVSLGKPKFDIAKYSPDWELLTHVQTAGTDVTAAFPAGTLRCADNGKNLLIHTAHQMESGHQANYTIELDMESMNILYDADRRNYVSHSFNQFVLYDGDNVVMLDQGDFYPRSVILQSDRGPSVDMITYSPLGDVDTSDMFIINFTGVSVGGFAQSSTHYLAAYNSIDQDNWYHLVTTGEQFKTEILKNIYVAAVPKNDLSDENVQTIPFTDYTDLEDTCGNPYLVPVGEDRFLLIWAHRQEVCYTFLDGAGNMTGEIYTAAGWLSDCEPVVSGDRVYWYTWEDAEYCFYSIDLEHPEQTEVVKRYTKHEFVPAAEPDADGNAVDVCTICGLTIPHDPQPTYLAGVRKIIRNGDRVEKPLMDTDSEYLDAGDLFETFISNISVDAKLFGYEMLRGEDDIERNPIVHRYLIKPFDAPAVTIAMEVGPWFVDPQPKTLRITAKHSYELQEITEPKDGQDGSITLKCSGCGHVSTFAMHSMRGKNGEQVSAAITGGQADAPAVTVTLTDPETGEPVVPEPDQDYTAAFVHDPEKDTFYAVIVAAAESRKITGSLVFPYSVTEIPEPVSGDADGDGKLTGTDAELLTKWLLSDPAAEIVNVQAADMNQDQKLDAADLSLLRRALLAQTNA
ncbi:MAG: dockerin type I repeat-containing protein [Oscillospiraceae bacterium]|nr:dockerin type I repeat-containing protein [Oscillospiraceae bacterium]